MCNVRSITALYSRGWRKGKGAREQFIKVTKTKRGRQIH